MHALETPNKKSLEKEGGHSKWDVLACLASAKPWGMLQTSALSLAPIHAFMEEQCTYKVEALDIWCCSAGTGVCLRRDLGSHPGGRGFGRPPWDLLCKLGWEVAREKMVPICGPESAGCYSPDPWRLPSAQAT